MLLIKSSWGCNKKDLGALFPATWENCPFKAKETILCWTCVSLSDIFELKFLIFKISHSLHSRDSNFPASLCFSLRCFSLLPRETLLSISVNFPPHWLPSFTSSILHRNFLRGNTTMILVCLNPSMILQDVWNQKLEQDTRHVWGQEFVPTPTSKPARIHICAHAYTHVVFKPHELLSFLKMPSFHILPYLSTVSSFFLVDIINTNPNFETLLKYLFLCKKWKLSPSVTTCQGYLLIYACMHVLSRLTLCNPMDYTLSVGFSRKEYWSGLIFLTPGDLPNPGIEPPASLASSALAGGFFSVEPPEKP